MPLVVLPLCLAVFFFRPSLRPSLRSTLRSNLRSTLRSFPRPFFRPFPSPLLGLGWFQLACFLAPSACSNPAPTAAVPTPGQHPQDRLDREHRESDHRSRRPTAGRGPGAVQRPCALGTLMPLCPDALVPLCTCAPVPLCRCALMPACRDALVPRAQGAQDPDPPPGLAAHPATVFRSHCSVWLCVRRSKLTTTSSTPCAIWRGCGAAAMGRWSPSCCGKPCWANGSPVLARR